MTHTMNWIDTAAMVILGLTAMSGLSRGFFREILGISVWVAAAVFAARWKDYVTPYLTPYITDAHTCDAISYGLVFLGLASVGTNLSRSFGGGLRISLMGNLDRLCGLVFGAVKGYAMLVVVYALMSLALPKENWPQAAHNSQTLPYIYRGAVQLCTLLPDTLKIDLFVPPPPSDNPPAAAKTAPPPNKADLPPPNDMPAEPPNETDEGF